MIIKIQTCLSILEGERQKYGSFHCYSYIFLLGIIRYFKNAVLREVRIMVIAREPWVHYTDVVTEMLHAERSLLVI